MSYRLKNRTLQAQLDAISDGDFTRRMLEEIEARRADTFHNDEGREAPLGWSEAEDRLFVSFGKPIAHAVPDRRFTAVFEPGDIEAVPDIDPVGWNKFPEVTPPIGQLLEIEFYADTGDEPHCVQQTVAAFVDGAWQDVEGRKDFSPGAVLRFRLCDKSAAG